MSLPSDPAPLRQPSTWLLLFAATTIAVPSGAQAPPIYAFGEVVVTAESPRVVEEVTTVDVVTAEDIERSGARTLAEAVELLPGIQLRRGAQGFSLLDLRGMRARNVLVLLDGVPLGSSFDGLFDPETLPLTSVARIEVTRGASSVLYGPSGNAGVVDVVTRAAPHTGDAQLVVEGGTPETSRLAGRASWRRGDLGLTASATFFDQAGFDLSDDFEPTTLEDGGRRLASDREDRAAFLNLTSTPDEGARWGLTLGYRGGERGKPPVTEDFRTSIFAPRPRFERVESDAVSLHAGLWQDLGPGLVLRPTLFANRETSLTDGFDDAGFDTQEQAGAFREDATSTLVGAGAQLALERPGGLWTLAVDVRRERREADGFERVAASGGGGNGGGGNGGGGNGGGGNGGGGNGGGGTRTLLLDENHSADIASVALEHELDPEGPWSAVVGLGFAAQERPDADDESGVHWLLGARRSLGKSALVRGSVARQVRFPTLRDLFDADRGNPDLRPERTLHYELAVETALGAGSRLELALFHVDAEDFVQGVPGGRLANTEQVRRRGLELTWSRRVGDLGFVGAYTYLDAENRSPDADVETLQNQPEHSGNLAVDWSSPVGLDLRGEARFLADSFALSRTRPTRTLELGDYTVFDLRAAWKLRDDSLRLVARIDNLLDKSYQDSIGFPAPGRTFTLGFELR